MNILMVHERELAFRGDGTVAPSPDICGSRGGGLAAYVAEVTNALRRRAGVKATLLAFDPNHDASLPPAAAIEDQHTLRSFRFRYRRDTVDAFRDVVERMEPDLVHLQGVFHEMHPRMMDWLLTRYPVVWTLHDVRPLCFRGTRLNRRRQLCSRAVGFGCVTCGCFRPGESESRTTDVLRVLSHARYMRRFRRLARVLVPSRYMRQALVQNGFDAGRIDVTPLFTRFGAQQPSDEPHGLPPRILFVGRLDHGKGVEQFLRALGMLAEERWQAVIVGDGPLHASATELAADLDIAARVEFVGAASADALTEHYRRCDFLVFSSILPESFGMVGVESMSFGRPVVAFASGGVTEWLEDGVSGLLVPHGDVAQLAERMKRLIRQPGLRGTMGRDALRAVEQRFTLDRHVDQLLGIYQDVSQQHTPEVGT